MESSLLNKEIGIFLYPINGVHLEKVGQGVRRGLKEDSDNGEKGKNG